MKQRKEKEPDDRTQILTDPVNEQVVLAAAIIAAATDPEQFDRILRRAREDAFSAKEHHTAWRALKELARRKLEYDPATLQKLSKDVDVDYLAQLIEARPEIPANLDYHLECLAWDHARVSAANGPVSAFLDALKSPGTEPARVKALARQVSIAFDGYQDRRYMLDASTLIRDQVADIRERMAGRALYPFGVPGLDMDKEGAPILIPGAKPGMMTVLVGVSGGGKTTFSADLILGLARQKRRVVVGAWEVGGGLTLELLACKSLGFSRTALMCGQLNDEQLAELEERMTQIAKWVRFMANPFMRERREKPSVERNLDLIHGYLADAGAEVFVADLWRRCLPGDDVGEEEFALYRQQAMLEELRMHGILLHQLRLKDLEQRADKRPTRESIMGTSAWVGVADTIFGVNRPALWKPQADDLLEVHILKQRWGKWPMLLHFPYDPEFGSIGQGELVPYEFASRGEGSSIDEEFAKPNPQQDRKPKRRRN